VFAGSRAVGVRDMSDLAVTLVAGGVGVAAAAADGRG